MFLKSSAFFYLVLLSLYGFTQPLGDQRETTKASFTISLNMSGWNLGNNRLDKDDSEEGGRIIYQVRIDSDGNVVSVRPMQQTVSPSVESFYRRQVLRFKLRSKGIINPSDLSTGTLTIDIKPVLVESRSVQNFASKDQSAIYLSISVLRYRGKVIDVSPISRDYFGEEDFHTIVHKILRSSIDPNDALEMISNYDWTARGDKLYKSYSSYNQKDPTFLSKTVESIKVK